MPRLYAAGVGVSQTDKTLKASETFWWIAAAVAVVLIVGVLLIQRFAREKELRSLPKATQSALYVQTMQALKTACAGTLDENLQAYCQEQAELLADLPECDAACQKLAERFDPQPSR